jgi:hypothetical protein
MGSQQQVKASDSRIARELLARMGYSELNPRLVRRKVEKRARTCVAVLRDFVESECWCSRF